MSKKQIIVIEHGLVMMGQISESKHGYIVENCVNLRHWGTTRGLGQIALTGPTDQTIMDDWGTIEVEKHKVILRIDCVV